MGEVYTFVHTIPANYKTRIKHNLFNVLVYQDDLCMVIHNIKEIQDKLNIVNILDIKIKANKTKLITRDICKIKETNETVTGDNKIDTERRINKVRIVLNSLKKNCLFDQFITETKKKICQDKHNEYITM